MKENPEAQILQAAKQIFFKKGYHGARMREIATRAGINKGLLHYYFKTKDALFHRIFTESFQAFAMRINDLLDSELPLEDKISSFIHQYIDFLLENPSLPAFIIHELHQRPGTFIKTFLKGPVRPDPMKLAKQLEQLQERDASVTTDPKQLIMNMVSLCVFPFAARPIFQELIDIDEEQYFRLMHARKESISALILQSLTKTS